MVVGPRVDVGVYVVVEVNGEVLVELVLAASNCVVVVGVVEVVVLPQRQPVQSHLTYVSNISHDRVMPKAVPASTAQISSSQARQMGSDQGSFCTDMS